MSGGFFTQARGLDALSPGVIPHLLLGFSPKELFDRPKQKILLSSVYSTPEADPLLKIMDHPSDFLLTPSLQPHQYDANESPWGDNFFHFLSAEFFEKESICIASLSLGNHQLTEIRYSIRMGPTVFVRLELNSNILELRTLFSPSLAPTMRFFSLSAVGTGPDELSPFFDQFLRLL